MMGRQKEKEVAKNKRVRKHHCPNWHEYEQIPGDGEGRGSLRAAVYGVTNSQTWLRDRTTTGNDGFNIFKSAFLS